MLLPKMQLTAAAAAGSLYAGGDDNDDDGATCAHVDASQVASSRSSLSRKRLQVDAVDEE